MYLCVEKALMEKPYLLHLNESCDLETTYEAIRSGFITLALEKNQRATPLIAEARTLKIIAQTVNNARDLLNIPDIQAALLTASGISDKAKNYLHPQDKVEAIQELIVNFLEPAGTNFVEELVYRFLLIRGDTLGGIMRNAGGSLAQSKFTRSLLATLRVAGIAYDWLNSSNNQWREAEEMTPNLEILVRGVSWLNNSQPRTIIYNVNVPLVNNNNIDLCLLKCDSTQLANQKIKKQTLQSPDLYIALGELKGGIDPAGADEHWKTARTALQRIDDAFRKISKHPYTFFIGAAIEPKMAREIYQQLETKKLTNAGNLTNDNQLVSIIRWLCHL
jgi:hypothetical protein